MRPSTYVIIAGGALLLIPVAINPVSLTVALVLAGLFVGGSLLLRWLGGEWIDLKKSREMGRDADFGSAGVRDYLSGSKDDRRRRE